MKNPFSAKIIDLSSLVFFRQGRYTIIRKLVNFSCFSAPVLLLQKFRAETQAPERLSYHIEKIKGNEKLMIREYLKENVYEALQQRFDFLFREFPKIYVSFSGGKDSGTLLNLLLDFKRDHYPDRKIGLFHQDFEAQYAASSIRNTVIKETAGFPNNSKTYGALPRFTTGPTATFGSPISAFIMITINYMTFTIWPV